MSRKIAVIGLGYVGLPLAIELAKYQEVIGFDIDVNRINELQTGYDKTGEVDQTELENTSLRFSCDSSALKQANCYIVTVPTPLNKENEPDLTPLQKASETLGPYIKNGDIIVYESTVYPGVTEDFCGPILEEKSGLISGKDFYLGYSPERINPGDKVHTVKNITKIVSGQNYEVLEELAQIYGKVNNGKIHKASTIKVAEAAKVIENAQRDINIAFMNEIMVIFNKMGICTYDVLDAAKTKWNFLPFSPGLVGGHCIGIDPYYLATAATQVGCNPQIILSGRETNETMSQFMANLIHKNTTHNGRILLLGFSFKENVPDCRNTKVADLVHQLKELGHVVTIYDPVVDGGDVLHEYGLEVVQTMESLTEFDSLVLAVPHEEFVSSPVVVFHDLLVPNGSVFDLKGIWRNQAWPQDVQYLTL